MSKKQAGQYQGLEMETFLFYFIFMIFNILVHPERRNRELQAAPSAARASHAGSKIVCGFQVEPSRQEGT